VFGSRREKHDAVSLRVGLNLAYLVEDSGGSGTYARHLLPHLLLAEPDLELTAWIGTTAPAWLASEPWARDVRWVRLPVPGIGSPWHLWHELVGIGLDARRRGLDLVHGLANLSPVIHPGLASVTTVLDVIWMHHPEATDARFRAVMRTLVPLVGLRSTRIIAISHAARDDIAATLHLDVEKFDVTPLGIIPPTLQTPVLDRGTIADRLDLGPEPIVLCVAAKRAHKNLDGLIRAFALLSGAPAQLVLPGSPNAYELELRALAHELGVRNRVHFPDWISEDDLEDLYRSAACFVLPSLQEGFGLPVLEAMARGLPVACSDIPALTEVVADAALLFDPREPVSIADAITQLITDRRLAGELVKRGDERCRALTWERTAEATLESYRRALGGG
jgi:glycosyltransferase involved in cell wall biosynthesis